MKKILVGILTKMLTIKNGKMILGQLLRISKFKLLMM